MSGYHPETATFDLDAPSLAASLIADGRAVLDGETVLFAVRHDDGTDEGKVEHYDLAEGLGLLFDRDRNPEMAHAARVERDRRARIAESEDRRRAAEEVEIDRVTAAARAERLAWWAALPPTSRALLRLAERIENAPRPPTFTPASMVRELAASLHNEPKRVPADEEPPRTASSAALVCDDFGVAALAAVERAREERAGREMERERAIREASEKQHGRHPYSSPTTTEPR